MDDDAAALVRQEVKVERARTPTHRIIRFRTGRLHGRDAHGNLWRLDKYLQAVLPTIPRTVIRRWLDHGFCTVDGAVAGDRAKLRAGQLVELTAPLPGTDGEPAEGPALCILHRGDGWLAVDKPPGLLAHEAGRTMTGTLLNQIQDWAREEGLAPEEIRLVNRIDKDTSGIVLASHDLAVHQRLSAAMEARDLHKEYRAIAHGAPADDHGDWREAMGEGGPETVRRMIRPDGQDAWTAWRVLERAPGGAFCLFAITLHTGRQHQIRLHASHHGHPLVGDWVYGTPCEDLAGQALHSAILELDDPTARRRVRIEAPLPAPFADLWTRLAAGTPPRPRPLSDEERRKLGLAPDRPAVRLPDWLTPEEFARLEREG
ncbi:MAG: hypothetical protein RLZZ127_23 [Planctomycetota bacterium]|jgi:23S rRNA pseudouridine1911/1915/1917 synthase